jgi:polyisoprenoid-binding protein YceI
MMRGLMTMAGVACAGLLFAAELRVSPASQSTIVATFKQEGVAVESPFMRFTGTIAYDSAKPAASTALIDVDMDSLDIGDPAYSAELRKKSWFDTTSYPRATFRATTIKSAAPGQLRATGQLSVKGKVQTITVPIKVSQTRAGAVFDGSFGMSRKAFGIGDPIWEDALDDQVLVRFHLVGGK